MSYKLKWIFEAEVTFNQNLDYLAAEWSNEVLNKFIDEVEEVIYKIRKNPSSFPLYKPSDSIRKAIINKRIVLFYRVVEKEIELLTFWNTYQNPENLKL